MTIKEAKQIVERWKVTSGFGARTLDYGDFRAAEGFLECAEKAGKLEESSRELLRQMQATGLDHGSCTFECVELEKALAAWREVQG